MKISSRAGRWLGARSRRAQTYQVDRRGPSSAQRRQRAAQQKDSHLLTPAQTEAIKLVVSEAYGCTYCLAAHTLLGKKGGLAEADTIGIRRGSIEQPKLAALAQFVRAAIQPAARVSDSDLAAVRAAGYNDAQITEALMVVAQTVFTNLFNRVHQTPLDFPAAPSL